MTKPICVLLLAAAAVPLAAANRALFVAVSQYDKKIAPLPGVQRDLAHMREVAALMGFDDSAICTLTNARTREILESIDSCLVRGATSADAALLYFTLHGSQTPDLNGDEKDDGLDEIFITSDTVVWNGRLRNYLLDDDLNKMLAAIPARHILVIVDACHSGTSTKGISPPGLVVKAAGFMGDPQRPGGVGYPFPEPLEEPGADVAAKGIGPVPVRTFVVLSACKDKEEALASPDGSVFTTALAKAARSLKARGEALEPAAWLRDATELLKEMKTSQHPQLTVERAPVDRLDWFRVAVRRGK